MELLYSNILPMGLNEGQSTILEAICNCIEKADRVDIAVGYVSRASLEELDNLIRTTNINTGEITGMQESEIINC